MNPITVPAEAARSRPECTVTSMGPPPGVSGADCGTVQMLREWRTPITRAVGQANYAYFRPTEHELESLCAGGFIEFGQYGQVVQPFSATVWRTGPASSTPPPATEPMPQSALGDAVDAACRIFYGSDWDGMHPDGQAVCRAVMRQVIGAALPGITAAIADRLHKRRFDHCRGDAPAPDTFYSGVVAAEAFVRATSCEVPA